MRAQFCLLACCFWALPHSMLLAQDSATVTLETPAGFTQSLCPQKLWTELPIQWLGTTDRRSSPEVGLETKKNGKDPIGVLTQPPLASTIDTALQDMLSQCGMKLVQTSTPWKMYAFVEEFRTEVEKGLIFGKGKAKSQLRILAESPNRKLSASVGYEIEFKKTRKKSLQRLTEALNELLRETLRQVPRSTQLQSMGN